MVAPTRKIYVIYEADRNRAHDGSPFWSKTMGWRNSTNATDPLSIGMHWFMLVLIAAVYALMELRGIFPKGSGGRELMKTWHYMLGLSVLIAGRAAPGAEPDESVARASCPSRRPCRRQSPN